MPSLSVCLVSSVCSCVITTHTHTHLGCSLLHLAKRTQKIISCIGATRRLWLVDMVNFQVWVKESRSAEAVGWVAVGRVARMGGSGVGAGGSEVAVGAYWSISARYQPGD